MTLAERISRVEVQNPMFAVPDVSRLSRRPVKAAIGTTNAREIASKTLSEAPQTAGTWLRSICQYNSARIAALTAMATKRFTLCSFRSGG